MRLKISLCPIGENIKSDSYDFVSNKVPIRRGQDVETGPISELKKSQFGEEQRFRWVQLVRHWKTNRAIGEANKNSGRECVLQMALGVFFCYWKRDKKERK